MKNKDTLLDFVKEKNAEILDTIANKLKDEEIQFAIDYVEKLNTISTHVITKIGHTEDGDFFVNCETGITYLK